MFAGLLSYDNVIPRLIFVTLFNIVKQSLLGLIIMYNYKMAPLTYNK